MDHNLNAPHTATALVRILVADRYPLFREAVESALDKEPGLHVVATVGEGIEAVTQAERLRPDVALISSNLLTCDSYVAASVIHKRVPACRLVILAADPDDASLLRSVEAGASAYLPQATSLTEMIAAVRAVHDGDTIIPPAMLGRLLHALAGRRNQQAEALRGIATLTQREMQVLSLLARGANNDALAAAMFISPQTARTHVQHVLAKLDLHSRLEAAAWVNQSDILAELDAATLRNTQARRQAGAAGVRSRRNRRRNPRTAAP